jgi:hypothetical protein
MINDWRPISTALKDNKRTHVLLYFRDSDMTVRVGYWMPSASLSATADGRARASVFSSGRCKSSSGKPTPAW